MANEQVKGFANNFAASAFYDWCKNNLAGPAMTAAVVALWGKLKHGSLDWWAIGGMFLFSAILMLLGHRKNRRLEPLQESNLLPPHPPIKPSRLKILSAYYGIDGGPDSDVADKYLRPRMVGDALAGWVGADLFGAFDPAIGIYKRLKVRYSFEGREAVIERRESELLVLPEDPYLKKTTQTAVENLFSPLQIEAFQLAKELRGFLKEIGPHPEIMKENGQLDQRAAVKYTEWSAKFISGYRGRFAPRVESFRVRVGQLGLTSCYGLDAWTQGVKEEIELQLCAQTLELIALELGSIGELRFSREEVKAMTPKDKLSLMEAYPGFKELASYYSRTEG